MVNRPGVAPTGPHWADLVIELPCLSVPLSFCHFVCYFFIYFFCLKAPWRQRRRRRGRGGASGPVQRVRSA